MLDLHEIPGYAGKQQVRERRNQLRHPDYPKPVLFATQPNQVWTWDITKLLGPFRGICFYLYTVLDMFSRYVVGWMVAGRQAGDLARVLVERTCEQQKVKPHQLVLHADRGDAMTAKKAGGKDEGIEGQAELFAAAGIRRQPIY